MRFEYNLEISDGHYTKVHQRECSLSMCTLSLLMNTLIVERDHEDIAKQTKTSACSNFFSKSKDDVIVKTFVDRHDLSLATL